VCEEGVWVYLVGQTAGKGPAAHQPGRLPSTQKTHAQCLPRLLALAENVAGGV
jgi:hypothetical protein